MDTGRYDGGMMKLGWIHGCALGALVAVMFVPAALAQQASVEFVKPRNLQTILGPTKIVLQVDAPSGTRVERLEIYANDELIGTLTGPPWTLDWDAGDSGTAHRLEARLLLGDGKTVTTAIRTSKLRVSFTEDVSLVNLFAVVRDKAGDYVTDLALEDFIVTENDRREQIERFTTERKPLRIGIVLDTSLTMEGSKLDAARKAALDFLDSLDIGDLGSVVTFSDEVRVLQELTDDRKALATAIESVSAAGGTALYDAIYRTSRDLGRDEGRKILVLLSDGRDEAANGLEPGSLHTLAESLDRALRDEVIIFAIGLGRRLDQMRDFYGRRSLQSILEELATSTGGRAIFVKPGNPGKIGKAFDQVADDLRHMYSIAYVSDDDKRDGTWRRISVQTSDPQLVVSTRRGYYAPKDDASGGAE